MSLIGVAICFVLFWWVIFFAVLPLGIVSQEGRDVVPGHDPGAPVNPNLIRKALITTGVATALTGLVYFAFEWQLVSLDWLFKGSDETL